MRLSQAELARVYRNLGIVKDPGTNKVTHRLKAGKRMGHPNTDQGEVADSGDYECCQRPPFKIDGHLVYGRVVCLKLVDGNIRDFVHEGGN